MQSGQKQHNIYSNQHQTVCHSAGAQRLHGLQVADVLGCNKVSNPFVMSATVSTASQKTPVPQTGV